MPTRRTFLAGASGAAASILVAPAAALGRTPRPFRGGRFPDGVLSGDPTPTGITLQTRLAGVEGSGGVTIEVARDRDFRRVVSRRVVRTDGARNHTVKARVTGLRPYEQYFYRFSTATRDSRVGRFRTALPADSRQPVRFGFFSCQDYTHGYYNAHGAMARDDLDFVVCLGDYIYAEAYHTRRGGTGVRDDRIGLATTLQDYRDKYALYRSDKDLQAMHAAFPMIATWDDHEVQNNYAGGEPDGGLEERLRYSQRRRRDAYRAFFEHMPFLPAARNRVYRSLRFGRTVDLLMMDQRQYRDDQPCGDAVAPACAEYGAPRDFLGRRQMEWVKRRIGASPAAWKVMGNELTIMPTKVLGDAFFEFDSWQGYPGEREDLLEFLRARAIKDVVFVTGDIHTFIAGDVRTQLGAGESVAVEFVGGSISSWGLGEMGFEGGGGVTVRGNDQNPSTPPALIDALRGINPWVDAADFDHHGYGRVTATQDELRCDLVRLQTVKRRTRAELPPLTYRVARGQTSVKGQNGPPAA
jgi:alkaline phosphatase D